MEVVPSEGKEERKRDKKTKCAEVRKLCVRWTGTETTLAKHRESRVKPQKAAYSRPKKGVHPDSRNPHLSQRSEESLMAERGGFSSEQTARECRPSLNRPRVSKSLCEEATTEITTKPCQPLLNTLSCVPLDGKPCWGQRKD
jgi:hypothetical protein